MSDLDRELRQAIKAGVDRSLEGWTFTPAMRQAVLERIAAEKEPAATPDPPRRQSLRPVYWVTAAAAALILAVNLLPDRPGDLSGGSAPEAASTAITDRSGSSELRIMAAPGAGGELNLQTADAQSKSGETAPPEAPGAFTATMAPVEPVKLVLSLDELKTKSGSDDPTRGDTGGTAGAPPVMTMSVQPTMVDLTPLQDGKVAVLNSMALQVVDQAGNVLAEEPVAPEPTALADGPAGEPAVVSGNVVSRFRADGQPAGSLELDKAPARVAVAADRVAVADASGVKVYAGDVQVHVLDGLQAEAIALAEDGSLAVLTGMPRPRLQVYSSSLALMMEQDVEADGSALAFLAGGSRVAAGRQVYDRSGAHVWSFPFAPDEIVGTGSGAVLAWNPQTAALVRAETGETLWLAEAAGGTILRATAALDNDLAAVVVGDDGSAGVWVIDAAGTWRHAEPLDAIPVDVAVTGDHLHILLTGGLEVRSLRDESDP